VHYILIHKRARKTLSTNKLEKENKMNKKTLKQFCTENNLDETLVTIYKTEEEKLEAVKQNGYSIRYISNPSEAVQLEAVKQMDILFNLFLILLKQQLEAVQYSIDIFLILRSTIRSSETKWISIQYFKSGWFSDEVEELTVAQIEELLGKRIKIVK
jgi:hypothetical protein